MTTESDVPRDTLAAVQRLQDTEAIADLKARYFRFIDTKDWVAFRDLFTDDCRHHLPEESPVPFMSNDEYFPMMEAMLTNGVTTHHGYPPEITFSGEREAEAIWAMHDYVQVDVPSWAGQHHGVGPLLRDVPQMR